ENHRYPQQQHLQPGPQQHVRQYNGEVDCTKPQDQRLPFEVIRVERQNTDYNTSNIKAAAGPTVATKCSSDMVCGVCLEVVLEKDNPSERRFGILPNCSHCYCLECIRTWRTVNCRTRSHFFIPSDYWVEDKDDKLKLTHMYKDFLASKPCRYFHQGPGKCHFGSKCFYKHHWQEGVQEGVQDGVQTHNSPLYILCTALNGNRTPCLLFFALTGTPR
uniref:RING-type E3 ubiquitin transferase n=1 Tax=Salmo trutta TaxID=8032 RepID=A0A674BEB1_SALTR